MALTLGTASIIVLALLWALCLPRLRAEAPRAGAALHRLARGLFPDGYTRAAQRLELAYDPGRELRAEQRARALLRSCVEEEDWAMYQELGFLRVWGRQGRRSDAPTGTVGAPYAYLLYPHEPLVAYIPQTGLLLNEYCVAFPDEERPYGSARLPDSDDVLAKWMGLKADERGLIGSANMHLPGRQVEPQRVRRDLQRLARWEAARARAEEGVGREERGLLSP